MSFITTDSNINCASMGRIAPTTRTSVIATTTSTTVSTTTAAGNIEHIARGVVKS